MIPVWEWNTLPDVARETTPYKEASQLLDLRTRLLASAETIELEQAARGLQEYQQSDDDIEAMEPPVELTDRFKAAVTAQMLCIRDDVPPSFFDRVTGTPTLYPGLLGDDRMTVLDIVLRNALLQVGGILSAYAAVEFWELARVPWTKMSTALDRLVAKLPQVCRGPIAESIVHLWEYTYPGLLERDLLDTVDGDVIPADYGVRISTLAAVVRTRSPYGFTIPAGRYGARGFFAGSGEWISELDSAWVQFEEDTEVSGHAYWSDVKQRFVLRKQDIKQHAQVDGMMKVYLTADSKTPDGKPDTAAQDRQIQSGEAVLAADFFSRDGVNVYAVLEPIEQIQPSKENK